MTDINKKIEQLERDCGKNWELAFDNFLLTDLGDVGKVQELFTETDLYLFWLSMAYEVNELLNELLENERRDEALRLIRLKRIVDSNLLKLKDETEINKDLEFDKLVLKNCHIELNCGENQKKSLLENLYALLIDDGFIDGNKEVFFLRFEKGVESGGKINWLGKQKELLSLIKFLRIKRVIRRKHTDTRIIVDNFEINGKTINRGSVEATLPTIEDWGKKHQKYLEICRFMPQ
jgi:hypothetical protein